jgi:hypothetical protein
MIISQWQYSVRPSAAPLAHGGCTRDEIARRTDIIFVAGIITALRMQHYRRNLVPEPTVTIPANRLPQTGGTLNSQRKISND